MLVLFVVILIVPFLVDAFVYDNVIRFYRNNKGRPNKEGMLDVTLTLFAEYGICPSIKSYGKDSEPFGAYSITEDTIYANSTVKNGETLLDMFIFIHEVGHCVQLKEKDPRMMLFKRTMGVRTAFSLLFVTSTFIFTLTGNALLLAGVGLCLLVYIVLTINDVMCEKKASQFAIDILSKGATKKEKWVLNKFMRLCYTTYIVTAITGVVKSSFRLFVRGA